MDFFRDVEELARKRGIISFIMVTQGGAVREYNPWMDPAVKAASNAIKDYFND